MPTLHNGVSAFFYFLVYLQGIKIVKARRCKMLDLLKQNYIIIKIRDFKKLNETCKNFLENFFDIKEHERFENLIVLEKNEKYIFNKIF